MSKKTKSGQKRKNKSVKRIKRKNKKSLKNQVRKAGNEIKKGPKVNLEKVLNTIPSNSLKITCTELVNQADDLIERKSLDLADEDYEKYMDVRSQLLSFLIGEINSIQKTVTLQVGLHHNYPLKTASVDLITKAFMEKPIEEFIYEMLNKACEFDILSELGEKTLNKPIILSTIYWFEFIEEKQLKLEFQCIRDKVCKVYKHNISPMGGTKLIEVQNIMRTLEKFLEFK